VKAALSIRAATPDDAEPLLAIYRPFVLQTAISFELEPPSPAEFRARIERSLAEWAWVVAERDGRPVGYAYATAHRPRGAYKWSVEPSVYIEPGHHRLGIGTLLYDALMPRLAERGYCNAYAGITLPNEPSVALHRRVGFELVGVFRSVGRKFGAWHDVSWWHRRLRPDPPHTQ
jgi:L-amino acid N-acyltransferase YncA